jgi:hypothetical protein
MNPQNRKQQRDRSLRKVTRITVATTAGTLVATGALVGAFAFAATADNEQSSDFAGETSTQDSSPSNTDELTDDDFGTEELELTVPDSSLALPETAPDSSSTGSSGTSSSKSDSASSGSSSSGSSESSTSKSQGTTGAS